MKKISLVGLIIIILGFLFLLSSKIGTQYAIRYQSSEFKTSADKKDFQEKLEQYLFLQGYKKLDKNPKWALVSFGDKNKREISFYANTADDSMKSIFYLEDCGFNDKMLIVMYVYVAATHPIFIDSKNEKLHNFGLEVATKFSELAIESDGYRTFKEQQ